MKNYFLLLAIIVFIIADIFVSNAIIANQNINKTFEGSGYILKYSQDNQRYYFEQETKYKNTYNNQITFKNTDGEKIAVDKDNFIHYDDGSISSFVKGVLLDLETIDTDPITYYNVSANKVLKKLSNNKYVTKNLDKEIQFTNLMWKISDSKYLLASDSMKIVFGDGTEKDINGFVEIEYSENEVVRIFNKDVKYETISSEVYLKVGEDIKVNLGSKIISKKDKNEMTLANMVIDSNDNVTIIDFEEEKDNKNEENRNNTTGGNTIQGGNAGSISGGNVNANGGTTVIGGNTIDDNNNGNNNGDNNQSGNQDTEIDDLSVYAPKYIVKEFEVTTTGLKALVEIKDDEARLTTGTTTTILNNATGKVVYSLPETGMTEIRIDTSSLSPDTEYTLVMEAEYAIEGVNYKKNFIYKIFRTPTLGVTLEKDLFTEESLAFNIKFERNSNVTKLDVELLENGQKREEITNSGGSTERIEFSELSPDTEYTIQVKNIYVDNISNKNTYSYKYKTLKSIPKLANGTTHTTVKTETDKWNSKFVLSIPELTAGIVETLNYQIFTQTEGKETLVYNKVTTDTELTLPINSVIQRNKDYYCRVFATFYDNEKVVEYEIANTETSFNMNSSEMPSVRFETENENSITFNSIKGNLIIDDAGNTINVKTAKIEVIYSSTTKGVDDTGTLTYTGIGNELTIPIDLKELKSNETYKFSIYANYDLHDDNGERYGFIGSIMITTKQPIPMKANWTPSEDGININLRLTSTEGSDLEAQSLYSFELALYLGQAGASNTPIATSKLVDNGLEQFAASLKEIYYNNKGGEITKDTFGLTNAQIEEIEKQNRYCTIVLSNAKDYVSRNKNKNFENDLPIISNSISYKISESEIRNPSSSKDAVKISSVSKAALGNLSEENLAKLKLVIPNESTTVNSITTNKNINNTTTVAYKVSANISTSQANGFKYFEYFVYDKEGNIIAQSGMIERTEEDGEIPAALFLLANGTDDAINDECLTRGNNYSFAYYAYKDASKETRYPFDEGDKSYWEVNGTPTVNTTKQAPNIIIYPTTSDKDSISYKYKISDVDNAIVKDNGKKYFYQFYADVAIYEDNKKEIIEGQNTEDANGYWTIKFDQLSKYYSGYNLEVKILQNLRKSTQAAYKTLTTQKLENILDETEINIEANLMNNKNVSSKVMFNNLSSEYRSRIAKVKIELIDKQNKVDTIVIEKSAEELNKSNWLIDINYLELIYKTTESIKETVFDVKATIYYIDGTVGYDNGADAVTYQTLKEEWLRIYDANKEFSKILNEDGTNGYPLVYENHTYEFDSRFVLIKQNDTEVSWLNYSNQGFTRKIDTEDNVVIIPKKVKTYVLNSIGEISLGNVVPGIIPTQDLEAVPGPTNITIKLAKIYSKDTVASSAITDVCIELYEYDTNLLVKSGSLDSNGELVFSDLTRGEKYYYKLYVEKDGQKYYLYDMEKGESGIRYEISTLDNIKITNLKVSYVNEGKEGKRLLISHSASVSSGYKGFVYQICDEKGEPIKQTIAYSLNNKDFKTTTNGEFTVELEDFKDIDCLFGNIYININRNTFFEYNQKYTVKVTPIILNNEGIIENIGNTISTTYSYSLIVPEVILYARRVENLEGEPYVEFSISISDDDYLIVDDTISYKIYKNGNTASVLDGNLQVERYTTIRIDESTIGDNFNFNTSYRIEVSFRYNKSNSDNGQTETVKTTKELLPVQNGMYIGSVNWSIENDNQIKLKFYDSYELSKIKKIKCSIYDVNGVILKNVPTINDVSIIDQTDDVNDPHKSITFNPDYTFEKSKSYIISIRFLDEKDNELAGFEPDSPVTNN